MALLWQVALVLITCFCAGGPVLADSRGTSSVWDGVYTAEQALRGTKIFEQSCQSCHAADMRGGPAVRGLVGLAFQFLWKDKTLAELYSATRARMPPGDPGSLNDQAYIDLVAAILQRNDFPSGGAEIKPDTDALQAIRITWDKP